MERKNRTDMKYYDYLFTVQQIAQKSHSIQKKVITQVFANFDACQVLSKLNRQIEHLDGLLSK
ncbi:MAG: hypothetical protein ACFFB0_10665 [Promethearchaeota archaeon]